MNTTMLACATSTLMALPAAAQVTPPPVQPTQPQSPSQTTRTAAETDDIVVTGLRASLGSARERKRNADQIVDAVVAEDIGKLPDNNAAEALARITGVQVARVSGEANQVLVRGLPDVTTTFNGREIFSYDGRNVALQDFPAAALQGLEVYKTTTADQVEGGIAGLVNVRSRSPFDFDGFEIAGTVRGTYNQEARKYDPNASLLVSDRWETGIGEIGALINLSYSQQTFLTSSRTDGGDIGQPGEAQTITTPGVGRNFSFPEAVGIFYARGKRWRPSVDGSIRWRPADNLEIYVEGLYQGFRGRDANDNAIVYTRSGNPTLSNVVLDADDPTKLASLTVSGGQGDIGMDLERSANSGDTDTYQGAVGARWETGRAKLSTDFAYTDSRWDLTQQAVDFAAATPPTVDIAFNRAGESGGAEFSFPDFDLTDPDSYIFRGLFDLHQKLAGTGIQWRGDLELETDWGIVPRLDFGLRYTDRTSRGQIGSRFADLRSLRIPLSDVPFGEGEVINPGFRGLDAQPDRAWFAPTRDGITNNIDALRDFARQGLLDLGADAGDWSSGEPAFNPLQAFDAREKSYTAYSELHYKVDAGIPIDGVIGARIVNTADRLTGTSSIEGVATPVALDQNYVDVLPSASLRARFTDQLQLRLSATRTRTRPAFSQLNPAVIISPSDPSNPGAGRVGSGGNINLAPLESKNYDVSLEYYFSSIGSATFAVFRHDVTGFIANFTAPEDVPGVGNALVTRPRNGGRGRIEGAEAAFTTFFDFLPGVLSGFGTQLNATYIKGSQALPAELGGDAPDVDIPGVSKWSYNLVALYEKGPISARLAYNYRSRFLNFFFDPSDANAVAGEYTRGIERLDFSLAVTPVKAVTFTFDVANITNQPFRNVRNYTDTQAYPRDIRYDGRLWALGARFRF